MENVERKRDERTRGERTGRPGQTVGELDLNPRAWEKESSSRAPWNRRKERKSGMEEITFDFELLGSVTLSPLVSDSARSSSLLPSSTATVSLSLRDSSAGQGRTFDDPDLAASSRSIGFLGDFQPDRLDSLSVTLLRLSIQEERERERERVREKVDVTGEHNPWIFLI